MSCIAFDSPSTFIISGPSGSGKSSLLFNILKNINIMFNKPVNKIYYFYSVWQDLFNENTSDKIQYIQNIPDEKFINEISDGHHKILIIDDLQISALNNDFIANLFTRESHHRNLSIFLILQNLFHQGKYARDISLNTHYFILFRNPRDKNQIKILGNQLGIKEKLERAYNMATERPYSYLMVDLSPRSESQYMLSGNILPDEYTVIYK